MILLSGSSHPVFAQALSKQANIPLGEVDLSVFANDERRVWVKTPVVNEDVIIVQSFSTPVDSYLIEYALLVDAAERAGARSITAVVPWMGYSLQDKVFRPGEPIAARVAADLISNKSVKKVIMVDLHNNSVAGFFSTPTTILNTVKLFAKDIQEHYGKDVVVISPDFGGLKRAYVMSEAIGAPIYHVDKMRNVHTGKVRATFVGGDIKGKTCIVIDDIINTGSTIVECARELKKHGAGKVVFYATHPLLVGDAAENLQKSDVDEVVVGDTVPVTGKKLPKMRIVSVVSLFADALKKLS
jgi:ribose-phosphate pyrophosphokinase